MSASAAIPTDARILITGGTGLVGTALVALLAREGFTAVRAIGSADCDLTDWRATLALFQAARPNHVIHLAARVYGIMGNMRHKGASFLDNVWINTHVIEAARRTGARKIVAMGSGCVYPYPAPGLPLAEAMVWSGPPHASEDSYAHAKRAMLAQLIAYHEQYGIAWAFAISGNLYGPNDRFDPEFGHVIPALVRKFNEARRSGGPVSVWGHGTAQRDFTYADDAAAALLAILRGVEGAVNLGSGQVHAIREIVDLLAELNGMTGRVAWDTDKPDGQDYRAYDLSRLFATGFRPRVSLPEGLRRTVAWYAARAAAARS